MSLPQEAAGVRGPRLAGPPRRAAPSAGLAWLRLTALAVVVAVAATGDPRPALDGRGLGVLVAIVVYAVGTLAFPRVWTTPLAVPAVTTVGVAAVVLGAFQPDGLAAVAASLPVFAAFTWFGPTTARAIGGGVAVGVAAVAVAAPDGSVVAAAGDVLLLALMALVATLIRRSQAERDHVARLYAELQETRDAQARAAAVAERGRIAGELHDVLAHSLSGAAIQLQGTRRMLARDGASPEAAAAVDRAADLVREGLADARRAVGALRGDALPTVAELPALATRLGADLRVDVSVATTGEPATEPAPEAGLALYRGLQEALTNAGRHAPGSPVAVGLATTADEIVLTVANPVAPASLADARRSADGGGHGLGAMQERVARAGGSCEAGPTPDGWTVRVAVPR